MKAKLNYWTILLIKDLLEIENSKFSRNFAQGISNDSDRGGFMLQFEVKRPGKV